jgi:hypothetical protein
VHQRANDQVVMYHGGSNPLGTLLTLQERQQYCNGQWDLPVLGYFVAPIGVSGGVHGLELANH